MTALNEHDQESALGQGPLSGVRVLDLTRVYAGPMCTMLLAELGADVIKVEDPTTGDETRGFPPLVQGYSGYYFALNRSKRAVTLDLKNPEGIRLAKELAAASDVLIESFTPGAAERLGIGYGVIAGIKPSIVYCSISGFGQSGPYRTHKGYDPILQAMSGLMSITGERGGGPVKTMLPIADAATALYSAISILAALHHVRDSGEGQYIDMAMLDVMVSMLTTVGTHYLLSGEIPPRSGTENPARVPSAAFECADGRLLQLVPNQRQWPLRLQCAPRPEPGRPLSVAAQATAHAPLC
jgi:crotonobetainyl-CoA:carnitine CoA-transferase CaiB-like acyl-CoA transferase